MYRRSQQEAMENSSNKSLFTNTVEASQFLTRFAKIPVVNSAFAVASDLYGKAKNSGGIIGKTIGVAEKTVTVAAEQVLPLANIIKPIASQPLSKIDELANLGLEKFETTVPIITKQPSEIIADAKNAITAKVTPVVDRINSTSDAVLGTKVGQFTLDCYEAVLKTVSGVVDYVLPPSETEKTQQNGFHYDTNAEQEKSRRLGYLFHRTVYLITSTTRRLLGLAQSRMDSAVTATDSVISSARNNLNKVLPAAASTQQNGEPKTSKSKPKQTSEPKKAQ